MQTKNLNEVAVFNGQDERIIDEDGIDSVLDIEKINDSATQKPTRNVRKSIEQFLERQRLRSELMDFDVYDEH